MKDNKVALTFVVQGTEVVIEANGNAPLRVAAQQALKQAGDYGRALADWEVKNESGNVLNIDQKVGDLALIDGALLYMTLTVGVNGMSPWVSQQI